MGFPSARRSARRRLEHAGGGVEGVEGGGLPAGVGDVERPGASIAGRADSVSQLVRSLLPVPRFRSWPCSSLSRSRTKSWSWAASARRTPAAGADQDGEHGGVASSRQPRIPCVSLEEDEHAG